MLARLPLVVSTLIAAVYGAARTSPPSGAIVVAKSGGQFTTIQAAVNSVKSSGKVIFIQPGTYEEQVLIPNTISDLTIYGYTTNDQDYTKNQVKIQHKLGADQAGSNDASGTFRAKANNLKVYNVNIANTRGKGVQAIALSAYGDKQGYYGCQFTGYQDTVLSNQGTHVFSKSYIEGATDFIFGQKAIAWFEGCTLGISGTGYITASGRDSESNPSWYVINKATVKRLSGVSAGATYLGRPWRNYARVVFQNSNLGDAVNKAGWRVWNTDNPNTDHVYYGEYANTGSSASGTRPSFATKLSAPVTLEKIVGSTSWIDFNYWNNKKRATEVNDEADTPPSYPIATTLATAVKPTGTPVPPSDRVALAARADACQASADGFASLNGGTTGGNGGTVVTVSTQADLEKYAGSSGKYVIKVKGTIKISPRGTEVKVASDKTIVGIGANAEISEGGFKLQSVKNVIFRNLKIGNTKSDTENDMDGIQIDTSSNIWIDHVHLEAAGDGLLDSRKDTTFLTVSSTIFRNHNKAFGIGWTDNVTAQITIHHCWFDNTVQRNPSADNAKYAHLYNNYLTGVTSYGHYARGKTELLMENVYFSKTKNPVQADSTAKLKTSGNVYSDTSGTTAKNQGTVFDANTFYKYTLDKTADVPAKVKANAGRLSSVCPS